MNYVAATPTGGSTYNFDGLAESHPIPLSSLHGGRVLLLQVWVYPMTGSTINLMKIKPHDSGVAVGYQIDEFTHTWSAEWFVAHSPIYPGVMANVSTLSHLTEDVRFTHFYASQLQTLNGACILSSLIPLRHWTWDTSFGEPNVITSSVFLGFLHLVISASDTCKQYLAPSIRSHKLLC